MIDPSVIREAVSVLKDGGLVIVPTDTVYGLAVDPTHPDALQKLFAAKGRDAGKPVALLAADVADVLRFGGRLTPVDQALADRWWPGPLTLVLDTATGSEGFRVPDCDVTRALLRCAGGVLRVSSANLSGEPPALSVEQAMESLAEVVDFVVDGGRIGGGAPSTVVKVEQGAIRILREGALKRKDLEIPT